MTQFTALTNREYVDNFIREVRVNYLSTETEPFVIQGPADVAAFTLTILPDNSREHCVALYLDSAHQVVSYSIISTGCANTAVVHPREIYQRAFVSGATAIVLAHNHPSGSTKPSAEDQRVTDRIRKAGELLGVPLLDHVIVTDKSFLSLVPS